MRVLILELNHHGHRFRYVRQLIEALVELPVELTLVLHDNARSSEQWKEFLEPIARHFSVRWSNTTALNAQAVTKIICDQKPDHVYLPYADDWLWHLAKRRAGLKELRSFEVEGLCLFSPFPYLERGVVACGKSLAKFLFCMAFSGVRPLHLLDANAHRWLEKILPKYSGSWIPDVTEPISRIGREQARASLGLPQNGFLIVLPGVIDRRKGVDKILEAYARALPKLDTDVYLILAGRFSHDITDLIRQQYAKQSSDSRLITINRFLSSLEFDAAIESADVVAAPYQQHYGSSSVVLSAAASGIPVLGSTGGWVGRMVQKHGLGVVADISDSNAFSETLSDLKSRIELDAVCGFTEEEVDRYSYHEWSQVWTRRIRERLSSLSVNQVN